MIMGHRGGDGRPQVVGDLLHLVAVLTGTSCFRAADGRCRKDDGVWEGLLPLGANGAQLLCNSRLELAS